MKRLAIYNLLFVSLCFSLQSLFFSPAVFAESSCQGKTSMCDNTPISASAPTCNDGKDNGSPLDGKADYCGVDCDDDGVLDMEPDPSCVSPLDSEKSDLSNGNILSCYNYCTFSDVLKTINNVITFLITTLFIPTIVLIIMFAGFQYITAAGNPSKVANLKKIIKNIVIGMLLVLCSWLIVKVILTVLVKDTDSALQFLE